MTTETIAAGNQRMARSLPHWLLRPLPLLLLQPALARIINHIARNKPALFNRLGSQRNKYLLIDPLNMPLVLLLRPDPDRPLLRAYRRYEYCRYDARIAGSFLTLLSIIDGRLDSDALFFSRDLIVEGDTEAIVCLRNALDDMDGSIAEAAVAAYGPAGGLLLAVLRRIDPCAAHAHS